MRISAWLWVHFDFSKLQVFLLCPYYKHKEEQVLVEYILHTSRQATSRLHPHTCPQWSLIEGSKAKKKKEIIRYYLMDRMLEFFLFFTYHWPPVRLMGLTGGGIVIWYLQKRIESWMKFRFCQGSFLIYVRELPSPHTRMKRRNKNK